MSQEHWPRIRTVTAALILIGVIAIGISAYFGHPFVMPHMRDNQQSSSR